MSETQTASLTDFLLQRIAEDEATARAATPGPWFADEVYSTVTAEPYRSARQAYGRDYKTAPEAEWVVPESMDSSVYAPNLAHIARHDPVRVLAECEAHRRIVEAHRPDDMFDHCAICLDGDFDTLGDPTREDWPCPTIRALASVYADREGFRAEWAL
jgi:phage terminase large subunit GpA-like protein